MSTVAGEPREGQPIYLYAIVPSGSDGQDGLAGTDTGPGGLSTIAVGPYSAVGGSSPAPELKGRSREDLARLLIAHQKVLERLTRMSWVLPVKFGTRMPDEKGIYELLERGRSLFDSTFAELQGCTQLEISVTWDIDAEFADIASEVPVAQLKAQIADSVAGATAARRLALGRLVKQALDRRRAGVATHVTDARLPRRRTYRTPFAPWRSIRSPIRSRRTAPFCTLCFFSRPMLSAKSIAASRRLTPRTEADCASAASDRCRPQTSPRSRSRCSKAARSSMPAAYWASHPR